MNPTRIVVAAAAVAILAPLARPAVPLIPIPPAAPRWQPAVTFTVPRPVVPPRHVLTAAERETVAACLVLEAASQGEFGMRGVMAVIRNRAAGDPARFAPVVLQQKQFSSFNAVTSGTRSLWRTILRAKRDRMWPAALSIVDAATLESWRDPTGGATHYTRVGEHARWTHTLACTAIIGRHAFYR